MSVTLKDIARACGVSVGTVSRALNDKREVSSATSDKIKQLAVSLGYVPNRAGRALSAQKNVWVIGILLPSINSPFFDDIKRGINQAYAELQDLGLDIVLIEREGWNVDDHLAAVTELQARGCRALALCTVNHPKISDKINEIAADGVPVVLINNNIPEAKRLCFVGPDYYRSGQIAAGMLDKCRRGQEINLLIVMGLKIHEGHSLRVQGFLKELDVRHVKYRLVKIVEGMDNDIITQQACMQAFGENPEIDTVYMATGSGVSGLGAALIASRKEPKRLVIASDEIYTTRELVRGDIIDFVICQDPQMQGYQAIKKLHECLSRQGLTTGAADYIVESSIKIKNHFER